MPFRYQSEPVEDVEDVEKPIDIEDFAVVPTLRQAQCDSVNED